MSSSLRKHWWKIVAPLALIAVGAGIVLSGEEGEGRAPGLLDLRVLPAAGSQPTARDRTLLPAFDRGEDSYVARCEDGRLAVAGRARRGATVSVAGSDEQRGSFRASVPVEPGRDFEIRVGGDGEARTYRVRCLPEGFPDFDYESFRKAGQGRFMVTLPASRWVIVFDEEGVPRWWQRPEVRPLGGQVLRDGNVVWSRSFGDGYGIDPRSAHEVRSLDGELLRVIRTHGAVIDPHEHYALENGDTYVESYLPRHPVDLSEYGGPSEAAIVHAEIEQLDPEGREVWRWTSAGRIGLEETGRWWPIVITIGKPGPGGLRVFDPFHINTIEPWGDQIIVSMRHTDAVYGLDRGSGEVLWKLGGTATPESLRVIGDRYPEPFGGQHDARVSGDGELSVYDNSVRRGRPPRGVIYDLDLERRTATFRRQLTDPKVRGGSKCCGSLRAFAGGWLIGWGDTPWVTAYDGQGRITFRMRIPGATYRAIPVPPEAVTAEDLEQALEAAEST
jgi:hypothetical protein